MGRDVVKSGVVWLGVETLGEGSVLLDVGLPPASLNLIGF